MFIFYMQITHCITFTVHQEFPLCVLIEFLSILNKLGFEFCCTFMGINLRVRAGFETWYILGISNLLVLTSRILYTALYHCDTKA